MGTVQFEGYFGDQSEIHVLVRYRGAGCDEPGVPAHQFHEGQAVVNTPRFRVCAVENLNRFLNRCEVTESARHKRHVVVYRFRDAYYRERMTSLPGFLKERVAAALGAIAADGEQDMNIASNEIVHSGRHIDRAARSPEYRSAVVMNLVNKCGCDHHRFRTARGVKTLITAFEPENLGHSIGMMEFKE